MMPLEQILPGILDFHRRMSLDKLVYPFFLRHPFHRLVERSDVSLVNILAVRKAITHSGYPALLKSKITTNNPAHSELTAHLIDDSPYAIDVVNLTAAIAADTIAIARAIARAIAIAIAIARARARAIAIAIAIARAIAIAIAIARARARAIAIAIAIAIARIKELVDSFL